MNYTFPSKLHLKKKFQFDRVFNRKQKLATKYFTFFYCRNEISYPRLGVGISKKNIQKASQRNFLKRMIREEFRLNQNELDNFDLLIFVNSRAKEATKEEVYNCLKEQIKKLLADKESVACAES